MTRLERWADFMETLSDDQVKMDDWTCGSAACALGWACRVFKDEGLYLGDVPITPRYDRFYAFRAGAEFFGLSRMQIFRICDAYAYDGRPTGREVAERIREVSREK